MQHHLAIIPQPFLTVLEDVLTFWHDLVGGSWGWAIILLTFTIRSLILPLTFKSVKSMQKLQVLQPEMKKIQERYKDDRQRMNQEMMIKICWHRGCPAHSTVCPTRTSTR